MVGEVREGPHGLGRVGFVRDPPVVAGEFGKVSNEWFDHEFLAVTLYDFSSSH